MSVITNHFVSLTDARKWYQKVEMEDQVDTMLANRAIIIGPPQIYGKEILSIRDGRYSIISDFSSDTSPRKNQPVH